MFNGLINQFCQETNQVVREKGFWDAMDISVSQVSCVDSDGSSVKATKDAFIAQKVGLIAGEAFEAVEAMRKNNYGIEKKDSFEDELADVFIRVCDLCGELNIDIEKQIKWKLNYNASRGAKHGKEF